VSPDLIWGVLGIVALSLIGFGMLAAPPWMSAKLGERRWRMIGTYLLAPAYLAFVGWNAVSHFLEGDQTKGLIGVGAVVLGCAFVLTRRIRGSQNSTTPGTGASE